MRITLHVNYSDHQLKTAWAIQAGFAKHGIAVHQGNYDVPDKTADIAVVWGWRQQTIIKPMLDRGAHVLIAERGFLPDRFVYTSLGFDGLNGRATFPAPADDGERFDAHWGHLLRPWRDPDADGHTLLCGQVPEDAALGGTDHAAWVRATADALLAAGHRVRWRPHPLTWRNTRALPPDLLPGNVPVERSRAQTLAEDLAGAALCVTCNSNSGVEAALAGIPVVACDRGSMAWDVAAHGLDAVPLAIRPHRRAWCRRLSWSQWSSEEIAAGDAWDVLRTALP